MPTGKASRLQQSTTAHTSSVATPRAGSKVRSSLTSASWHAAKRIGCRHQSGHSVTQTRPARKAHRTRVMPVPAGSTLLASHPSSVNPILASRHSVCTIKWLCPAFPARTASSTAFVQKRYAHENARAPQPPHARRHMHARERIMRARACASAQTHTNRPSPPPSTYPSK